MGTEFDTPMFYSVDGGFEGWAPSGMVTPQRSIGGGMYNMTSIDGTDFLIDSEGNLAGEN